jgi:hypothetical protein
MKIRLLALEVTAILFRKYRTHSLKADFFNSNVTTSSLEGLRSFHYFRVIHSSRHLECTGLVARETLTNHMSIQIIDHMLYLFGQKSVIPN